jgi:aminotransferase
VINVFEPQLGAEELAAVREVFESGWVGRGARTDAFEAAFARHLDVPRLAVHGMNSCTEALFLSMELLGIGPGDEVILPTISFVGAGNAVAACGATPVFCDVDRRTLNATVADIERQMTPRTRAIMLLHYGGFPGDVAKIAAFARERSVLLIEDAACAVASKVDGQACGTFGDVATWSFDSMKIVVSGGDGAMIYVRDPDLAELVPKLTYMGLETRSGLAGSASADRWWEFEISSFSRRSILNDLTSAIGLVQLAKLPEAIKTRRGVHERYDEAFSSLDWVSTPPSWPETATTSYYFYWLQLDDRDRLARHLLDRGVYTTFRYYPLHLVSLYGATYRLPSAEAAASETICIPIHHGLTDADVDSVIDAVLSFDRSRHRVA